MSFEICVRILAKAVIFVVVQISKELKQYHDVEKLDDVRVIRDRQTSKHCRKSIGEYTNDYQRCLEVSGF